MNDVTKRTKSPRGRRSVKVSFVAPTVSEIELAKLGGGEIAYIKHMGPGQAKKLFPSIKGLPQGIELFSLHAADGTPLAITDTWRACFEHAQGDKLNIATVH